MLRKATGRLRRLFQRFKNPNERVKINFGGKLYIGFTLFIGFAAVNTGNNMLYILLSFLLSLMGISGFLSRYNLKGFKVKFFPPEEIWCCKPEKVKVKIINTKRFPSFLIELQQKEIGLNLLLKLVERDVEVSTPLVFSKRGIYHVREIELKSTFPFGLFERSIRFPIGEKLLVYPQPKEINFKSLPQRVNLKGELQEAVKTSIKGTSAISVKEYQGEGFSAISWKHFAKYGELYVKQFEEEEKVPQVFIDMEALPGSKEDKISYATYLVRLFRNRGYAVGIKCLDKREIPPSAGKEHYKNILECLAFL